MKKMTAIILAMVMMMCFLPTSASAKTEILKTPVLQYKILNHDKIQLRWTKIDGANKYYIYQLNDKTGKYAKKYEVKAATYTIKNLNAENMYSYYVKAVKENVKSERSNIVTLITPAKWCLTYEKADTKYIQKITHFDGSENILSDTVNTFAYANNFTVKNGIMYYIDGNSYAECQYIRRNSHDGDAYADDYEWNEKMPVVAECTSLKVTDDRIYVLAEYNGDYFEYYNGYDLEFYSISLDGEDTVKLVDIHSATFDEKKDDVPTFIHSFAVNDEGIYYIERFVDVPITKNKSGFPKFNKEKYKVCRMNFDGSDKKCLFTISVPFHGGINIFTNNNKIYYYIYDSDGGATTEYSVYKLISANKKAKKVFTLKNTSLANLMIDDISGGYFYLSATTTWNDDTKEYNKIYYKVNEKSAQITKSKTPFEWKY